MAVHSIAASYSAAGLEVAALAALDVEIGDMSHLLEQRGVERRARLLFDHPHAVIAVTGTASDWSLARAGHSETFCLPLFVAWVDEPRDAQPPNGIEEVTLESWNADHGVGSWEDSSLADLISEWQLGDEDPE